MPPQCISITCLACVSSHPGDSGYDCATGASDIKERGLVADVHVNHAAGGFARLCAPWMPMVSCCASQQVCEQVHIRNSIPAGVAVARIPRPGAAAVHLCVVAAGCCHSRRADRRLISLAGHRSSHWLCKKKCQCALMDQSAVRRWQTDFGGHMDITDRTALTTTRPYMYLQAFSHGCSDANDLVPTHLNF